MFLNKIEILNHMLNKSYNITYNAKWVLNI